ncbi:TonB-dependent receptor [Corallococcus praedator]|uniref:TonB-dependent receptor n=1 Tax=Corallococcus praedator TaxID=2316724 RepID=A0ABX9QJQ6_9BACT|nr:MULTISPECIES: TonB-dependent receptor [Corallococcus]RKH08248.1 TonB-dependent receptor [Corallococcus sp. CA047B]RKH23624.1 TonB-dependent receptor [Corallococcus sp. CA031C]RKI08895.1 TonB-dependent receptor [Corallococcus praedator]
MQVKHVLRETGVVLAAGLLYGSAAFAQSSVIIGTVINTEDKKPAADVVVTATSPNLQGEQIVVTDAQGNYRIPQLPPGTYTLRFEKETFKPYARPEIQLLLNRTIRVNVELLPDSFTSNVDVIGVPPTIDVGSTNTGVNVDREFINRIAVARPVGKGGATRSFESLAELAPGAQSDQYGVSINGTTSPENGYVVDGLSTNDPAFGVNASPLSIEFVQDVNIITGGYMPEFGRSTGGVINAVTRSGSNEFHGSVFANWTPGFAEGTRKLVIEDGTTITGLNALSNLGDFGATLGGPILKDKLWFFAGFTPAFQRYEHTRALNAFTLNDAGDDVATDANGFSVVREIPGSQRKYFADSRTIQYMGKLTYLINQDHNVSFALNGTPTVSGGLGKLSISPRTGGLPAAQTSRPEDIGLTENRANSTGLALKYAGAFMDKKVLVDANAGWFHQTASTPPADGSAIGDTTGLAGYALAQYTTTRPLTTFENVPNAAEFCGTTAAEQELRCPATNYFVGGPGYMSEATLDRYQINAKATYLLNALGTHVFKAGVDTEFLTYDQKKAYSGSVFWQEAATRDRNNVPIAIWSDNRRYGYQTAPDTPVFETLQATSTKSTTIGGFLQDSWSIANRVTLNLGVRYDVQSMYGGDGNLALQLGNQWSPRIGAVLDPFANGRAKLFVNFARYYEQVPLNMMDRAFPGERRFGARRFLAEPGEAGGCDPSTLEGQRGNCADRNLIVPRAESSLNANELYSGGLVQNEPVDPDISPQSSDEFVVGGEYELLANTRLGATYTHRDMGKVIEDMSRDDGNTYFLGNPGSGFAKEFPTPVRDYDAVTVYLNRTFTEGWLAQASYTWSRLYGNYPGLFRPENNQLDPNILADFDLIALLNNRKGLLPFDRTHAIKVFGAKEINFSNALSASIGLSYRGNSGQPINYLGAYPGYGQDETFILPRGTGGRTPWINSVDSNVGVNYRVSKDSVVTFTLDVFNLFNFQGVDSVDESYTFRNVLPVYDEATQTPGTVADLPTADSEGGVPRADVDGNLAFEDVNKNFKNPDRYQAPRQIRFGVRYTF